MSTTKTFMDWKPNQDWTVNKPNTTTDVTSPDFDMDSIIDKSWTNPQSPIEQSATRIFGKENMNNNNNSTFDFGKMFSADNIGGTLQGIGAIGGALASIYGVHEQSKFNDDMLDMEKDRVNKEYARRDKQQAEYDKVWKKEETATT